MAFKDLVGQKFGLLHPLQRAPNCERNSARFVCVCDCLEIVTVHGSSLTGGKIKSCGCLRAKIIKNMTTHGHTRGGTSPTYRSWQAMISRCTRPSQACFERYGGRGIKVCDRWRNNFQLFLADMGERPEGMTLDRIDSNGNYEPQNCRWATKSEQARNMLNEQITPPKRERTENE